MNCQSAKNYLESLHIVYLTAKLKLKARTHRVGWDLTSAHHDFELKTKLYYLDKREGPADNAWYFLPERQRINYEAKAKKPLYWIILAATPKQPLYELSSKPTENYIAHRDIIFAPWSIYEQFPLGKACKSSKLGPGRSVSIKGLRKTLMLEKFPLHKANLFLPVGENLEYLIKN